MSLWKSFSPARVFRTGAAPRRLTTPFRPSLLALEDRTVPTADLFADATLLAGPLATAAGSNVGAGAELGEPAGEGTNGAINSVWWKWTAEASGSVEVNTIGSDFDTLLAVYTGSAVDGLALVGANDDAFDGQSQLVFEAVAGTTYFFAVDGFADATGNVVLNLGAKPANDDLADATAVAGGTVTGANLAATGESGEPAAGVSGAANTVWWSWAAAAGGSVTIDTVGSNFDTLLAVYTRTGAGDLALVAANDDFDAPNTYASRVTFDAAAGTTYLVAVDGFLNETGRIVLNLPDAPPANAAPSVADQAFAVDENSAAGTAVGAVAASDADAGQTLRFAFVGGNESGAFAIDAATGRITVANAAALDYESRASFALAVQVTDDGGPALSSTATVTVNLRDVNEAPVLDNSGSTALDTIRAGQTNNVGTLVADLLGGGTRVTDPDAGAKLGVAIVGADTRYGSWQFSTDGGATWRSLGAVSDGSARLLAADARVRFVPAFGYSGTMAQARTVRAWDQTTGVNGGLADTTASGGATAFSIQTETASLRVRGLLDFLF